MNYHLDLSKYELSLINDGLQIMIIENAKNSKEVIDKDMQQQYENFGLELLMLSSKIKLFDKESDLSLNDLKLMNTSLMFLADYFYQKSLKKTEKSKTRYYENCNLQFMETRGKINNIKSDKGCIAN